MKLYKYRPVRRISRVIARQLQQDLGNRIEIAEVLPNVTVINILPEESNSYRDCPQFFEFKVPELGEE